jgi:hypoxanthine phosphoribosyltransferase
LSSEKRIETDIEITKLGWSEFGNIVMDMAKNVSEDYNPDVVVGIGRSGLIPASIIVKQLRTSEFYTIIMSLYSEGKPPHRLGKEPSVLFDNVGKLTGKKVLVVDDFARTGDTIKNVITRIFKNEAKEVKSAVVGLRQDSPYKPDFVGTNFKGCLIFPWDSTQ